MSAKPGSGQRQLVIVGAGAAGLYAALCAARGGTRVTLISAAELMSSSSYWAQGGLAAAMAPDDSPALHLADTLAAGRGSVRTSAARVLTDEAVSAVEDLTTLGVNFDLDTHGRPQLGLEGGHGKRRIVHAGGASTGRRIIRQLSAVVAENANVELLEGRRVTALLTHEGRCTGVVLDGEERLYAHATVLSTGGAAALWARTTNPLAAQGGGLLLAHRAGAALADIELMQFHPTAVVADNDADGFLVTEAVRGEGAQLLDASGERFVNELAPRDEVARAVFQKLRESGQRSVGLDMRHVNPALFPNVVSALKRNGIDPEHNLVPVAPAAHYMMGGVAVDLNARSSVQSLYAIGECGCTGLHGANRLASNSLTECFVFGARAAGAAWDEPEVSAAAIADSVPGTGGGTAGPPPVLTPGSRNALWELAGLERDGPGLLELRSDPHPLVQLIATAALTREESRGAHWRKDFPTLDKSLDDEHVTLVTDRKPYFELWK